jgi:hypothetical protein
MLGIGLVTAVDQAGGTTGVAVGVTATVARGADGFMGIVVAAVTLGRAARGGAVGFRGRGGRLMRSVSRWGGLPSGFSASGVLPASAIVVLFIDNPSNVQWRNW